MRKKAQKNMLQVRISNATNMVWEGNASSVTSKNSSGPFDILPKHSNFLTLVRNEPIVVIQTDGNQKKYVFKESVVHVHDNKVKIFAEIE